MNINQIKSNLRDGFFNHIIIKVHDDLKQKLSCENFLLNNGFEWDLAFNSTIVSNAVIYSYVLFYSKFFHYRFIYSNQSDYGSLFFSDKLNHFITDYADLHKKIFPVDDVINLFDNVI